MSGERGSTAYTITQENIQEENHFSEMKGNIGISPHEKKGNNRMPTPKQKPIQNHISTSLFDCVNIILVNKSIVPTHCSIFIHKQKINIRNKQRCRDGVMNEFLF